MRSDVAPPRFGMQQSVHIPAISQRSRGTASKRVSYFLLAGLVAAAVILRFFTETWPVLPHFLNFFDVIFLPIFLVRTVMLWLSSGRKLNTFGLRPHLYGFLLVWLLSCLLNSADVGWQSSLGFLYLILCPVLFFLLLSNWDLPRDAAKNYLGFLFVLGAIEMLVTYFYQFPLYFTTGDPDLVAGTFGENNSQYSLFLAFLIFVCLSFYLDKIRRSWTAFSLLLLVTAFYAAGWRAMWLGFPCVLVVMVVLLTRKGYGLKIVSLVVMLSIAVGGVIEVGTGLESFQELGDLSLLEESSKVQAVLNVPKVYAERLHAALVGVGPGTYSSQAFLLFRRPPVNPWAIRWDPKAKEDMGGGRLWSDSGSGYLAGEPIPGFSSRYVMPLYYKRTFAFGSSNTDSPFMSYTSVLVEVGILGFLLLLAMYLKLAIALIRAYRTSSDVNIRALAFGCFGSLLMLAGAGLLSNWFEIARATVLIWTGAAVCLASSPNEGTRNVSALDADPSPSRTPMGR